ncbi:MAG: hypothetical protein MJA32_10205 [Proteobacteria bacterium]|nr:hypothetical protein [Pseudomonadota bacterium]
MSGRGHPLIVYIPGLLPKPEPDVHRDALLRCMLTGVRRVDSDVAAAIEMTPGSFDVVSWTYDFYRAHRDFSLDADAVDAVVAQERASATDIAEATSWLRRFARWIYRLGDLLPFLIPHVANERMEVHLRDLRRYLSDDKGIAQHTRRMLKAALRAAGNGRRPVLLIAHSMGSVIAYDSLWELTHVDRERARVDLLLTMGSPLGQRYMQKRLKGAARTGRGRFPHNVRCWKNLAAVGDLTALDRDLADDFGEMLELGLVERFEDESVFTYFRLDGVLNVHAEYGYLVNERTAHAIAEWWRTAAV